MPRYATRPALSDDAADGQSYDAVDAKNAERVPFQRAGDKITGRIFGQYLTMQRCEWQALAEGDPEILARAAEIARRDRDEVTR